MDMREFIASPQEQPLDNLPQNGGMTAILRTIAVVGDSLSSGEFEGTGDSPPGNREYSRRARE